MVVNSLAFLWFFLFVLVVYYLCQTKKEVQNVFLLGCSYWFYSQVDIMMTVLLIILTLGFWMLGKGIYHYMEHEDERKASWLTTVGVTIGIGALFSFGLIQSGMTQRHVVTEFLTIGSIWNLWDLHNHTDASALKGR